MTDSKGKRKDYNQAFPEPYNTIPPAVSEKKPGQLSEKQIRQFFEEVYTDEGGIKQLYNGLPACAGDNPLAKARGLSPRTGGQTMGFTVVEDFFTAEELQACRDDIDAMVDKLANKLYDAGKIKNLHKEAGLFQRLTRLEEEFKGANILLFKHQKIPKSFRDLWCNKRLLNLIEQLIGPDIAGHPVWNMRTKTPNSKALDVPWHQDNGYFSEESYDHLIPTAWIPFLDAKPENGCMQMVRYGHKTGKMARHTCCTTDTWFISLDEEEMEKSLGVDMKKDVVTIPIPYGSFLLFSNIIPHRSLANVSNDVRWSIDLRWQSPHENWGFYDIAEGILFRTARDGDVTPDWDKFLSVDRKEVWQKKYFKQVVETDHFDTTVTGPWIGRWEITNHNKHTVAFTSAT